jgi:hypothetical protein
MDNGLLNLHKKVNGIKVGDLKKNFLCGIFRLFAICELINKVNSA